MSRAGRTAWANGLNDARMCLAADLERARIADTAYLLCLDRLDKLAELPGTRENAAMLKLLELDLDKARAAAEDARAKADARGRLVRIREAELAAYDAGYRDGKQGR